MSAPLDATAMPSPTCTCGHSSETPDVDTNKYIAISPKSHSFDLDEEKGFWGEEISEEEDGYQCSHNMWQICATLICSIFGVIAALMVMHGFGKYLFGPEMAGVSTNIGVEMRFCLYAQPTNGVGPRIWEYISPGNVDRCQTGFLTMFTTAEEALKMHHGDTITVINKDKHDTQTGYGEDHEEEKFLDGDLLEGESDEDLGDDLAEEGKLRMPPPGSMHAGFGGPWRRKA